MEIYDAEPAPVSASYNAHTNQLTVEFNHNLDDSKLGFHAPPGMTLSADEGDLFVGAAVFADLSAVVNDDIVTSELDVLEANQLESWLNLEADLELDILFGTVASLGGNYPNSQLTFVDNFHVTN